MIEYLLIGSLLIVFGLIGRTCPDRITDFYMFISHAPMKKERWRKVWRFLGKYLILGGALLVLAGCLLPHISG